MSNFGSHISQLWNEILKHHWLYLESEESTKKLEERKKLEEYLHQFLSVVRHDRKFFLPETALVLKNSIRNVEKFDAQKAIFAFEAISQYANNLFAKPWRKEFHTLKMYSGFYQHEIKANLIDAEKLFEAMGYRILPDQVMILGGPICPDQVTNVSRDAMTAYVELQIIKFIHTKLSSLNCAVTWLEIYQYRENHIGDPVQAIKNLIYLMQAPQYHGSKGKFLSMDNYDYIGVQSDRQQLPDMCPCQCRSINRAYCIPPVKMNGSNKLTHGDNDYNCAVMQQQPSLAKSKINMSYNNVCCPHISHTRSLEHYIEPNAHLAYMPHHCSFDQHYAQDGLATLPMHYRTQRKSSYYDASGDYTDGGNSMEENSTNSYATVTQLDNAMTPDDQSYNVSGTRYPLPYNISHKLATHYDQAEPTYAQVINNNNHTYATVTKSNLNQRFQTDPHPMINPLHYPCSRIAEQRFNEDESAAYGANYIKTKNNCSNYGANDNVYSRINSDNRWPRVGHLEGSCRNMKNDIDYPLREDNSRASTLSKQRAEQRDRILLSLEHNQTTPTEEETSGKATTNTEDASTSSKENYPMTRNRILLESNQASNSVEESDYEKTGTNPKIYSDKETRIRKFSSHGTATTSVNDCEDSTDSNHKFDNNDCKEIPIKHDATQLSKNQDGVGSYETWNHVFKHLKHNGNAKDPYDGDELHLNSLSLNDRDEVTATDERHRSQQESNGTKNKTYRNFSASTTDTKFNNRKKFNKRDQYETQKQQQQQQQPKASRDAYKLKSYQKLAGKHSDDIKSNKNSTIINGKTTTTTTTPTHMTNDNNPQESPSSSTTVKEWQCRFCTFLNPDHKRVCEMCFKSKDFDLEAKNRAHHKPTCV